MMEWKHELNIAFILLLNMVVHSFQLGDSHATDTHSIQCTKFIMENRLCRCRNGQRGLTVDCSQAGIDRLPAFPRDATMILFSKNSIPFLKANAFGNLQKLSELHLDSCKIKHIDPLAFDGLSSLRTLKLNSNFIQRIPRLINVPELNFIDLSENCGILSRETRQAFSLLPRIAIIWLNKVCASNVPDSMFSNISNMLTEVSLRHNRIKTIPNTVLSSTRRIYLDHNHIKSMKIDYKLNHSELSLNLAHNRIKKITENDLQDYGEVKRFLLDMRFNDLSHVHPSAFKPLRYIHYLDLGRNNISADVQTLFQSISTSRVDLLLLMKINVFMPSLTGDFFKPLKNVSLLQLDLSYNRILYIDRSAFTYLPDLQHLQMVHCSLTSIEREAWRNMKSLTLLNMGSNHVEHFDLRYLLHSCPLLETLRANAMGLEIPSNLIFNNHTHIQNIDLSDNDIYGVLDFRKLSHLQDLKLNRILKRRLKGYNLAFIKIQHLKDLESFSFVKNKAYLYEKYKSENMFEGLSRLQRLDLSYNSFTPNYGMNNLFRPLVSLKYLYLDGTFSGFFKNLTIGNNWFTSQRNLNELYLPRNSIKVIKPFAFRNLHNLHTLFLSHNSLTSLPEEVLSSLQNIKQLNVLGNAFVCTCALRSFANFIRNNKKVINNWQNLRCSSPSNYLKTRLIDYHAPWITCDYNKWFVIGGILGLISVLVISSSLMIYYRWDIRYYFIAMKIRKRRLHHGYQQMAHQYDVFVCYQETDHDWVAQVSLFL